MLALIKKDKILSDFNIYMFFMLKNKKKYKNKKLTIIISFKML